MVARGFLFGAALVALSSGSARADDDNVPVKLEGQSGVVLERIIEGTDLWESLCVGKCDSPVPRDGLYRVTGRGVRPSLPLSLAPAPDGVVHLHPSVAYSSGFIGGIILSVVGPLVIMGGSIAVAVNNNNDTVPIETGCSGLGCPPSAPSTSVPNNGGVIGGGIAIGVGVALTVAGIIALAVSHHSSVLQTTAFTVSPRNLTFTF